MLVNIYCDVIFSRIMSDVCRLPPSHCACGYELWSCTEEFTVWWSQRGRGWKLPWNSWRKSKLHSQKRNGNWQKLQKKWKIWRDRCLRVYVENWILTFEQWINESRFLVLMIRIKETLDLKYEQLMKLAILQVNLFPNSQVVIWLSFIRFYCSMMKDCRKKKNCEGKQRKLSWN